MKHNFPSPAIVIPYLILGEGTFLVRSSDFKKPQNKSVVASRQVAVGEKQVRGRRRKPGEIAFHPGWKVLRMLTLFKILYGIILFSIKFLPSVEVTVKARAFRLFNFSSEEYFFPLLAPTPFPKPGGWHQKWQNHPSFYYNCPKYDNLGN